MIIDFETKSRMAVRNKLVEKGYSVKETDNAFNASNIATSFKPELFIVNLEMPRLDGIHLIRKFRKEEQFEKTPVIAYGKTLDKRKLLTLKELEVANVFLSPVSVSKLLESVEKRYRVKVIAEMTKED